MEREIVYTSDVYEILTKDIGLTADQIMQMIEARLEVSLERKKSQLDHRIDNILQRRGIGSVYNLG